MAHSFIELCKPLHHNKAMIHEGGGLGGIIQQSWIIVKAMVFVFVFLFSLWLGHKEGLVSKNWCFQTVMLEKTLESPLDSKDIKPVNPKGNHSWTFIGRTEAEAPLLWHGLKVKLHYFGTRCEEPTHWKKPWYWKRLKAGEEGGNRMRWLDGITESMAMM